MHWLMTGEGMPDTTGATDADIRSSIANISGDYAYIPLFDMTASAGHGEQVKMWQVSKKLAFRRDWLSLKELDPEQLSCIHVKGDSMEPTIPNGATILIDTRLTHALDGGIFMLTIDHRIFVKRTQWQPNGNLVLISDNYYYPTWSYLQTTYWQAKSTSMDKSST